MHRNVRATTAALLLGASAAPSLTACTAEERTYAPDPACEGALVCDDFESFALGAKPAGPWRVAVAGDGAVVVDGKARGGERAIKLTTPAGGMAKAALLQFSDSEKLPTSGNVLYGRMMVWIDSVPQKDLGWSIVTGQGLVPGQTYKAIYRFGGRQAITTADGTAGSQLMALYDTPESYDDPPKGPSTNCWSNAQDDIAPVGRWACVEWMFDGPGNELQFWLDGQGVPGLHVQGKGEGCTSQPADYTWVAPQFSEIYLGWETYEQDDARTVYIDDVVIGTKRAGCPGSP